jgi:hypothetical protein
MREQRRMAGKFCHRACHVCHHAQRNGKRTPAEAAS